MLGDKDIDSWLRLEPGALKRSLPPGPLQGAVLALVDRLRDATDQLSPCQQMVRLVLTQLQEQKLVGRLTEREVLQLSRAVAPEVETLWQQVQSDITPADVHKARLWLVQQSRALDGQGLHEAVIVNVRHGIDRGMRALDMLAPESEG